MLLITGGTGFIGNELSSRIKTARYVVRREARQKFSDTFIINNLDSETDWSGAFRDIDTIIHLAGVAHRSNIDVTRYNEINNLGTLHLAREASKSGVKRFVFVSSIGVNGSQTSPYMPFSSTTEVSPHNPYAQSKYDAEIGLKQIARETGLELVIVRPTLVYGPNSPGNFDALVRMIKILPILPFGLTKNRRDFISVQNLSCLLIECASNPKASGHIFLASDGGPVSTKDFVNAVAKSLSKRVFHLPIPESLMRILGKLVGKEAMIDQLFGSLEVDSSNIHAILGWTPPFTMEYSLSSLIHTKK